jgi:hypothetical protein
MIPPGCITGMHVIGTGGRPGVNQWFGMWICGPV